MAIKVLLVDKHPVTLIGLRDLIRGMEGVEVVGETTDFREIPGLNTRLRPDLVIADPGLSIETNACGQQALGENPPRVLIYSSHNSREHVAAVSLAGADGFVHKEVGVEMLQGAIRKIDAGQRVWMLGPMETRSEIARRARIDVAKLTPREKEILDLLLRRRSNPEIAEVLHVSVNTVRTHVKHVLKELGIESRRALLEWREAA